MFDEKHRLAAWAALLCLLLAPAAQAGDFQGEKPLRCVPTDMFECARGVPCLRATADQLNLPQYFSIDFKKKEVRGHGDTEAQSSTSPVENMHLEHGRTVLQGVEGGMAWSILIDQASGKMSMGVSTTTHGGHPVGFSILGICMAQ